MTDSDTGFVDEGVGVPPVEDLPLADAQAVVVCGGPNWKPQDRFLPLEVIRPVQVLTRAGGVACPWFDQYRDYGVSSIKLDPSGEWAVYATSTAVMRIWLHTGQFEDFEVPDLVDVHELTLAGDVLYAANTGRDEVVEMDAVTGKVLMRHSLAPFRSPRARALRSTAIETFHANQAFLDDDGHLMVLAHHAAGFRVLVHARRQLVRHGSGGVLDLTSGVTRDLRLFGPHNVRRHRDGWLINNSGRSEVMLLSTDWEVVGHLDLVGWGTGAAISDDGSILFGGIRATRRRYAKTGDRSETGVEVVALDGSSRLFVPFPRFEQVNGVELCSSEVADLLVSFGS